MTVNAALLASLIAAALFLVAGLIVSASRTTLTSRSRPTPTTVSAHAIRGRIRQRSTCTAGLDVISARSADLPVERQVGAPAPAEAVREPVLQ